MQLAFVPPPASPIRQQYLALKQQHPDAILFFQLGDFYETFEDDARAVAEVCDLVLTGREMGRGERIPMAGVPVHAAESYIARLVERGLHVALCQQMEDPVRGSSIVRRAVTRVYTPGTLIDPALLAAPRSNYLAAVIAERHRTGIAYAEVSTGEFACTEVVGSDHAACARAELWRLQPAECLVTERDAAEGLPPGAPITADPALFAADATPLLVSRAGSRALATLELGARPLAARAAAAILRYLERTQPRALNSLGQLRIYDAQGFMILDPPTRDHLELMHGAGGRRAGSVLQALDRTRTAMGARLLATWLGHPLLDRRAIEARLDAVAALTTDTARRLELQEELGRLPDLERLAARAAQHALTPREAVALAGGIDVVVRLRRALDDLPPGPLRSAAERVAAPTDLAARIRATVVDEPPAAFGEGVIRGGAVEELDELRRHSTDGRQWLVELERRERERTGVKGLKVGYNRVFGYYLEVSTAALGQSLDYYRAQESGARTVAELLERLGYQRRQTLAAAERFVTAELRDHEAQQARATTRMVELERAAFEALCSEIAASSAALTATAQALAEIDVFASFAQTAQEHRYVRPEITDEPITEIVGGRHPVVERALGWDAYIPDDVHLQSWPAASEHGEPTPQVVVLTGPNMAGKTTYGRMALLVTLLGQCGSFVPAERALLGLVDRVFLRSGAGDDIAGGQSTFMVEMTEAAAILRAATPRSLAFFDEVGRGTSTYDGMALARAIVEHLARPGGGCRTIFSTHYHELAEIATDHPTVNNFQMEVREAADAVTFTYRVVPGAADRSYGIHVAQLAGLPAAVLARAAALLQELEAPDRPRGGPVSARSAGPDGPLRSRPPELLLELADLDINDITPLEALRLLDRLRTAARQELSGAGDQRAAEGAAR